MRTYALYTPGRGPAPEGHPHAPPPRVRAEVGQLIIGLEDLWVATPEQRQELIGKMCRHRPHKTEGEVLEELSKMSSGDLYLMLINRHPAFDDLGMGGYSSDYDPLAAPPGRYDADNLGLIAPPSSPPSRALVSQRRNWYDHK